MGLFDAVVNLHKKAAGALFSPEAGQIAGMAMGGWAGAALVLASSVYGAQQQKRKAEQQREQMLNAQKRAYNDSLQDRMATRVAADSPAVFVYGRARVGCTIVAIFTSGAKDEYKHLVCVHAAHECDAFEEIYINGNALGALDGNGVPTSGKYAGKVRVKKHLGTASDPADATLMAECPTKWTSTAVLRGYCYTYIRLDLNEREFQGGLPTVEALLRGKKLYDPRTGTIYWSQNPALVIRDYLTSEICMVDAPSIVHTGTAQASASTTLTLADGASEATDAYRGMKLAIISGTGKEQERNIISSRKNLLLYSQAIDNAVWTKYGTTTVTPNSTLAPDNTLTADTINDTDGTNTLVIQDTSAAITAGTVLCASIYVKEGTSSTSTFNHITGIPGEVNGRITWVAGVPILSDATNCTQSIEPVGGGWYRWSQVFTMYATQVLHFRFWPTIRNQPALTGTAIVWGAQLEVGTAASDYIHTEASAAVGVAVNTTWATAPDATSVYAVYLAGELSLADFIAAANVCDENVVGLGARYTFNGTVNGAQDPAKMLEQMAQSMAGWLVSTTWDIAAGKYVAPVLALDQTDIVGDLAITPGASDADIYNGVRGQHISSETLYVATDFKPYQNAAYLAADGTELWTNIDFPFTDSVQRVHNLSRIFAEDHRNGYTVKAGFSQKAWGLRVGDRVTLTSALFGWSAKVFRVTGKTYSPTSPVELTLKEDAASIWDTADAVTADSTPNTGLPDPFNVGDVTGIEMVETMYETTGSAGVKSKAALSWVGPAQLVAWYEIEYRAQGAPDWIELFGVYGTAYDFFDIAPGVYEFRVQAYNHLGVGGSYSATKTFTVYGLLAPPANVSGFVCASFGGMAVASWTMTTDLDVKIGGKVQIRKSPLTTGATFAQGVIVQELPGDAVSAFLPLSTGTYMAKFVDSTGNFSAAEASFVVTEALVTGWSTVLTSTQHPGFAGTKTDCTVSGSNLIFTGSALTAQYAYAANMDCGTVASRRYHGHIKANAYNASGLFDSSEMFDSAEMFDETNNINSCDAWQEIRVSDDASTWSAWTRFTVADFSGRYAQVRLNLLRDSASNNIEIQELSTTAKVPV